MALRGDLLVLKIDDAVIAESTDVSLDLSAEALETTSQTSGLNATFIQGKVSGLLRVVSYLLLTGRTLLLCSQR
jgi:hypothetical protein